MQGLAYAYLSQVEKATLALREGLPLCEEGGVWCLGTGNLIGFRQGGGFSEQEWQLVEHYLACDPQDAGQDPFAPFESFENRPSTMS